MRMVNLCKNKLFNTGLMLFLCLGLQAQNKEMRRDGHLCFRSDGYTGRLPDGGGLSG